MHIHSTPTLNIVYQDDALLVLNKPSGLLSVPGRGADKQDCLSARVQHHAADACVVHRLDMATSGLIVMARGVDIQRQLQRQFANRSVHKAYIAIVEGTLTAPDNTDNTDDTWQCIDAPLCVDWVNRPRSKIDVINGKSSQTYWRVVQHPQTHAALQANFYRPNNAHTVVELQPTTGRSHQLRVHLQSIGHTIAGDDLYGDTANQNMANRLLLHAYELGLNHPITHDWVQWQCHTDFG